MANGWTPERKVRQAELIKGWQPWQRSTGAKTSEGKAVVSRNAFKGGHRKILRQVIRTYNDRIEQVKIELESAAVDKGAVKYLAATIAIHEQSLCDTVEVMLTEVLANG